MHYTFPVGFTFPDQTTENGVRESVAEAYIRPNLRRSNFHVVVHAHVAKVIVTKESLIILIKTANLFHLKIIVPF